MWFLLTFLACTGAPGDSGVASVCIDAPAVTWVSFGDGFFSTYCRSCHSAETQDRFGAPEGIDFDTPDQVRTFTESIRRVTLTDGTMPVGGGVYEDDLILLGYLLDCGL